MNNVNWLIFNSFLSIFFGIVLLIFPVFGKIGYIFIAFGVFMLAIASPFILRGGAVRGRIGKWLDDWVPLVGQIMAITLITFFIFCFISYFY